MIVYFSATGNSRYCAQLLSDRLGDSLLNAGAQIRQGVAADLQSETPWVFVCPTYAWRIPRIFARWIRRGSFQGSKDAYFVMTCGGETGDAQKYLADLCAEKGLTYRGLLPIVMPDNYLVMFETPTDAAAREILSAARPQMEEAARRIKSGETVEPLPVKLLDKVKSGMVNEGMYRYFIKTKPFRAADRCISCGKCREVCPLNNISLVNGRPQWGQTCTHCMACICLCPQEAIEYGKGTRGKARYHCPPYEG